MLTVACVLWMGDFEGRRYGPEWVYRLREMVFQWGLRSDRFVCLSNVDIPGVEVIPLKTDWPGWWAKVELFDPRNDLGKRVLYLDLDVFITGDMRPIEEFDAPMALMPPSHLFAGQPARDLPGVIRKYQSSCIVWTPPAGRDIYEKLTPDHLRGFRSDQDWIGYLHPDLPTMPKEWFAKSQQCKGGVPEGVKVVLAQRVNLIGKTLAEVAAC